MTDRTPDPVETDEVLARARFEMNRSIACSDETCGTPTVVSDLLDSLTVVMPDGVMWTCPRVQNFG